MKRKSRSQLIQFIQEFKEFNQSEFGKRRLAENSSAKDKEQNSMIALNCSPSNISCK